MLDYQRCGVDSLELFSILQIRHFNSYLHLFWHITFLLHHRLMHAEAFWTFCMILLPMQAESFIIVAEEYSAKLLIPRSKY